MRHRPIASVMLLAVLSLTTQVRAESITNDSGVQATVNPDGSFQVVSKATGWNVGGTISSGISGLAAGEGKDLAGAYREIKFKWKEEGARSGSIRVYNSRPVVIFSEVFDDAVSGSPKPFPILNKLPGGISEFRYAEDDHLRPPAFALAPKEGEDAKKPHVEGGELYGGPFVLFDAKANSLIVSPADDFMIAQMRGDSAHGIQSGLNRTLTSVPAGYRHQTILTMTPGINNNFDAWGSALTDLYGKVRPSNDADTGLKYLGYWTDNGGSYYYHYDIAKGYQATLLEVKANLDKLGIPIHYLQLDSWFYPKTFNSVQATASNKPRSKDPSIPAGTWNRYGGLLEYVPHPDLFPDGLSSFQSKLGVKLITHNRWIDPESPYHQSYKISGIAAVDPKWWEKIMGDLSTWGVETYEQDWNNYIYLKSPELYSTTWAGEAYLDQMAAAAAERKMTMQYCMVLPRHLMQGGAKYSNLTTVRVSGDRLDRGKWREFVYGSRMAQSLGVWPWTDVFRSKETGNMLVCSLSAGMVGLADLIGDENPENIFRAVRRDGVIVKPDVPLTPTDATYLNEAAGGKGANVVIGATSTTHGAIGSAGEARYVFAFEKKPSKESAGSAWSADPELLGLHGAVFAYDFFASSGRLLAAGTSLDEKLNGDSWSYQILVSVGAKSGMALVGDTGLFITRGKQRIYTIAEGDKEVTATVLFAAGESKVTLALYAPSMPEISVSHGTASETTYDSATGLAKVIIHVDPAAAPVGATDPVRSVEVTFKTH